MPGVELVLDAVALFQQGFAPRCEVGQKGGEPGPKGVGADLGPVQGLVVDKIVKRLGDADTGLLDIVHTDCLLKGRRKRLNSGI